MAAHIPVESASVDSALVGSTDAAIASGSTLLPIEEIARRMGIGRGALQLHGDHIAKVDVGAIDGFADRPEGKLILVTAMTPTPAGEGKTTTVVGLGDGLRRVGVSAAIALREPSLGPVFGMKGGATGGGYAQVVPMEDINLHFTGDFHAVGAANNLLAAMVDNHIFHGNALELDPARISWRRAVDINDRQLRSIVDGLGGPKSGVPRDDGFEITVASEVMAILCLSRDLRELKAKLERIIVGFTTDDRPVTAGDLKAHGAMAALLKDAIRPNLVQTLEHTPAFIHGGPFANIAHGCNTVAATRLALKHADYVVTEAGFGADLGAEKFIDIKARMCGLTPAATVVVATLRSLKMHGGVAAADLAREDLDALEAGLPNLLRHVENMTEVFGVPTVVALNVFPTDTAAELERVELRCRALGVSVVLSEVWARGGAGAEELAHEVITLAEQPSTLEYAYELEDTIVTKIEKVVTRIYGGADVSFTLDAQEQLTRLERLGFGQLPICMAKTQYSFSDDATLRGRPEEFTVTVRNLKISAGAGFIVVLTGTILTMPGLPKVPAAETIGITDDGRITGLF
ncbi:formate-tetrahydrofolate ligase [Glaciihabitans tibetensis]|uniref:Formate--tetrahydrofolate ligase n=1 Tax=Glaciihabitans tibetensis TaxID=1266600 RepID=A0A2T0VEP2_9MICO|nr:formate--tetrahydrofolate ligase [Glaciihabitans tibetensis]PRY68582.1 formate-tetrahydrofolate ligase [Glaciihabitans tibetensis]